MSAAQPIPVESGSRIHALISDGIGVKIPPRDGDLWVRVGGGVDDFDVDTPTFGVAIVGRRARIPPPPE